MVQCNGLATLMGLAAALGLFIVTIISIPGATADGHTQGVAYGDPRYHDCASASLELWAALFG